MDMQAANWIFAFVNFCVASLFSRQTSDICFRLFFSIFIVLCSVVSVFFAFSLSLISSSSVFYVSLNWRLKFENRSVFFRSFVLCHSILLYGFLGYCFTPNTCFNVHMSVAFCSLGCGFFCSKHASSAYGYMAVIHPSIFKLEKL